MKDAVLSQHWRIHHSTCRNVKTLKKPIPVEVTIENEQNGWDVYARLLAKTETGAQVRTSAAACCKRHYATTLVHEYRWEHYG